MTGQESIDHLVRRARELYAELDDRMRHTWNRSLPLEELLFDRWERARRLGFAEGSSIYHSAYVYGAVRVGQKTWIGPFTLLDGSAGGIEIGEFCSISAGVQIYTHDSVRWALSGGKAEYEQAPVRIGDRVYIGPNVVIAKGVTIGDHCVVGTGSFVNANLEPFSIAVGTPCRVVGRVVLDGDSVRLEYTR